MFSRISRYRLLPDEATPDARGFTVAWKSLRLVPPTPGTFLHTVEEADRLDHLGVRYYSQPRDWWRIADANPAFLSPWALLGKEPRATVRIPVAWVGFEAPWAALLATLRALPGVERAAAGTEDALLPTLIVADDQELFEIDPALAAQLDASVQGQQVTPQVAGAFLAEGGIDLPAELRIDKPDPATWILVDEAGGAVYVVRLAEDPARLGVLEGVREHGWTVEIDFDTGLTSAVALQGVVEGAGFRAGPPQPVGRVGKPVVVPPRRI
ncbi:MAG TPA: hypothetical protein VFJ82_09865 [Longimicrobium sp.]|nr:hypothetical protein [Longimicrobium sp.]